MFGHLELINLACRIELRLQDNPGRVRSVNHWRHQLLVAKIFEAVSDHVGDERLVNLIEDVGIQGEIHIHNKLCSL